MLNRGLRIRLLRQSQSLKQRATPTPSYAAVGSLPTGISFNTGTRVISGTPTAIASGTIRIRATNSQGSDDWTVAYATTAGVPTTSVTVPLTGIGLFTNYIRWSDNQSLGAVFDADGVGQTLTYAELNDASPTGRVGISIIGTNNRFTTAFEATGRIIFEASDGTTLEVVIADADTSEPYNWVPSNALEVATFVGHIRGLTDQDGTLTLIGATPAVTVPAFADNTGDAQSWTRNAAITNITVPAATGTPAPTYTAVGSLPAGIAFNTTTRAISGTPTAVGSGTITIRATNSEGFDDWTVAYSIAAALTVPVFSDDTGIAQNWTLGTAIATVTVPTADGNPTPSYAAVGALPAGINFNTGNRQLTGTPTAAGSGTIRIRATNNQGSDDWTVTYTTSAALTPPLFTDDTGVAQAWTQNVAIPTLTVPAASGNPTPSYAVVGGLPTGISFNTGNRRINGTPTAIGSGTIRIRATNSQGSDDWTVTYATAGPTITTDTDAVYMLAATTPTTPTGGTTSLNHTPAGWQRTAPSATTTQAVYRSQRTRTYTDGAFTSATTWGTPSIFANRLLTLAEYDTTGLEVDAAALFVAAAPTDIYADANRGGTQTPEDGELGIGAGQTLITRIRVRDNGDRIGLNDNDVPTALDMSTHFGAGGTTSAWTLTIQTAAWAVSSNQVGTSAGNFINWTFGADDAALLDGIGAGERVIIAIARTASVTPSDVVLSAQGLGIALAIGQPTLVVGATSEVVLSAQGLSIALSIGQPTLVIGAAPSEVVLSAQGLGIALAIGQPTLTAIVPQALSDFDDTGLEVEAAALLVASAPGTTGNNPYANSDRGGTDSPLDGELGLSSTQTVISRLRRFSDTVLAVNDNDNPSALDLSVYFGAGGDGNDLTLYMQTAADGLVSFAVSGQLANSGTQFQQFTLPAAAQTLLDNLDTGDRWIFALARTASVTPTDVVLSAQGLGIALAIGQPTLVVVAPSEVVLSAQGLSIAFSHRTANFGYRVYPI